jgi:hypothetical protein
MPRQKEKIDIFINKQVVELFLNSGTPVYTTKISSSYDHPFWVLCIWRTVYQNTNIPPYNIFVHFCFYFKLDSENSQWRIQHSEFQSL